MREIAETALRAIMAMCSVVVFHSWCHVLHTSDRSRDSLATRSKARNGGVRPQPVTVAMCIQDVTIRQERLSTHVNMGLGRLAVCKCRMFGRENRATAHGEVTGVAAVEVQVAAEHSARVVHSRV